MEISKKLNDALEKVAKEVESWPAWKRSVDLRDLKKLSEASENNDVANDVVIGEQKAPAARAAKA
ncbi:MAG: hypothetical protein WCA19_23470 [Candidatus Acidiferrales bacterium]